MTRRIVITPKASLDIDEHFAYITQESPDTALQFFDSVRQTFAQLARMPKMGRMYQLENPRLQGLGRWAVKGFKKYLVFYFEREDYIEIVRVLYGAQDIERILEQEP
jgi:toxin ParE1/3/4